MFRWITRVMISPDRHAARAIQKFCACLDRGDAKGARFIALHARTQHLLDQLLVVSLITQLKNDSLPWMRRGNAGREMAALLLDKGARCDRSIRFPLTLRHFNSDTPAIFIAIRSHSPDHDELLAKMLTRLSTTQISSENGTPLAAEFFTCPYISDEALRPILLDLFSKGASALDIPLHLARSSDLFDIAMAHLDHKDAKSTEHKNNTLRQLMWMPHNTQTDYYIRSLIAHGADPHHIPEGGECAYSISLRQMSAAHFLSLQKVMPLIPNAKMDQHGNSAWHAIFTMSDYRWGKQDLDDTLRDLIPHLAHTDPYAPNAAGLTPTQMIPGYLKWSDKLASEIQKARIDFLAAQSSGSAKARRL